MNRAKDRLDMLLDSMRKYNWTSYPFPGGHYVRFGQLLLLQCLGRELTEKQLAEPTRKLHHCWVNARAEQKTNPRMEYWEGFIANDDSAWPTPHAWNILDGKIVDTTVRAADYDYFGFNADAEPQLRCFDSEPAW